MPLSALTSRDAVLAAIREFDARGREGFLATYGFAPARNYFLKHSGSHYDSKAIVGVAHGLQHPELGPLRASDFSGGEATVKRLLEDLGFHVSGPADATSPQRWAFCANPARYRIREAVAHVEIDYWIVNRSKLRSGDSVAIWQTRDKDGNRGVVGLGQVMGEPVARTDSGNPYWVATEEGDIEKVRVPVRYHRIPHPLWVGANDDGQFLASLSVAKSQGGTVFHLTEEQWTRLCRIAGGFVSEEPSVAEVEISLRPQRHPASGQGFGLSTGQRKAVERHAMQHAITYFASRWDSVRDVSARCSFDLLCRTGDRELRVEVKGTTSRGEQVILTRREVEEASVPGYALFVLSGIVLASANGEIRTTGGHGRLIEKWHAEKHTLTPLAYSVSLDWSDGVTVDLSTARDA